MTNDKTDALTNGGDNAPAAEKLRAFRRKSTLKDPTMIVVGVIVSFITLVVSYFVYMNTMTTRNVKTEYPEPPRDILPLKDLVYTPAVTELEMTWVGGIRELFSERCVTCHSSDTLEGGLDLSTYQAALSGGDSGPGIVPGDAHEGMLITQQVTGLHDGQFSGDELAFIHDWVEAGAPEE